jgi:hypothetical protein
MQLLPELETSQSLEVPFNQGLYHPLQNERENLIELPDRDTRCSDRSASRLSTRSI